MLVLTRKKEESLLLGNDVEIRVLAVHGDQVRLGITAPDTLRILRKELVTEVGEVNRDAVRTSGRWLEDLREGIQGSGTLRRIAK
jgi:carbon storage regulator